MIPQGGEKKWPLKKDMFIENKLSLEQKKWPLEKGEMITAEKKPT